MYFNGGVRKYYTYICMYIYIYRIEREKNELYRSIEREPECSMQKKPVIQKLFILKFIFYLFFSRQE